MGSIHILPIIVRFRTPYHHSRRGHSRDGDDEHSTSSCELRSDDGEAKILPITLRPTW